MYLVRLIILEILVTSVFTFHYINRTSELQKVTVLSVATANLVHHHGVKRFLESVRVHGVHVELLGTDKNFSGFGLKWNLVREKLHKLARFGIGEQIVLYTDSYDVMFLSGLDAIVERFKEFRNTRILFSAEKTCWPDPDAKLAIKFPKSKVNPYLNAGGFIGYLRELLQLMKESILDSDDDQLHFAKIFIDTERRRALRFKLDHYTRIFLPTLKSDMRIKINPADLRPYAMDELTEQRPLIIHNMGPQKYVLDHITQYLVPYWPYRNSCTLCEKKFTELKHTSLPFVMMAVFIEEHTPCFEEFLQLLLDIDYPKTNIHLVLRNNVEYHKAEVDKFYYKYSRKFATAKRIKSGDSVSDAKARNFAKNRCVFNVTCDYLFVIDSLSRIRKGTLRYLMTSGLSVIAPKIRTSIPSWYDFWGCDQIATNITSGVWRVPFISNCYLLRMDLLPKRFMDKTLNYYSQYLSPDLALCEILRNFNIHIHLSNEMYFGYVVLPYTEGKGNDGIDYDDREKGSKIKAEKLFYR